MLNLFLAVFLRAKDVLLPTRLFITPSPNRPTPGRPRTEPIYKRQLPCVLTVNNFCRLIVGALCCLETILPPSESIPEKPPPRQKPSHCNYQKLQSQNHRRAGNNSVAAKAGPKLGLGCIAPGDNNEYGSYHEGDDSCSKKKEEIVTTVEPPQPPTSVFSPRQKRVIAFGASFAALYLPLNALIYLPALRPLAQDLGVTVLLVHQTIAASFLVAGIIPAMADDMPDNPHRGRRPVYLGTCAIMIGANVGIVLQRSYPAFFFLRMLQAAGASGMLGFAYGVIADIATAAERGSLVGTMLLMADIASSIGPIIGGALTQRFDWRSIFVFLAILAGTHFFIMLLLFPETRPSLVGDGSVKLIYQDLFHALRRVPTVLLLKRRKTTSLFSTDDMSDTAPIIITYEELRDNGYHLSPEDKKQVAGVTVLATKELPQAPPKQFRVPNPFACLRILRHKGSLTVVAIAAITSFIKTTLQVSLGAQCAVIYELTSIQAGLVYIPSGLGRTVGAYAAGRFVDHNYRQTVDQLSLPHTRNFSRKQPQLDKNSPNFPLETTRLRGLHWITLITVITLVGYGWTLETRTHISVMLVLQFVNGMFNAATFTLCGTLLTDLNPGGSASAQAADNLARNACSAVGVAVIQLVFGSLRPLRACLVYAGIAAVCFPLGLGLQVWGPGWRMGARLKMELLARME
ncbi:major facilitator superfamily domain-containing protein [Apodospora peruviana]|uniref:Major facilitator superfamily domain-containing protein n=1 Tax=Apodospora peruviana TaxID=516989 RepID=A0AAE0MD81_9PEZI|nr:major facilitator superfamily domain-containing protein [Apodospora peruviana]